MSDEMSTSRVTFTCLGVLAAIIIVGLGIFYSVKEAIDERRQASLPTLTAAPRPTPTPTPLPTPTNIPPKVVIEYDDGRKTEMQDWTFLYTYGAMNSKPDVRFVYAVDEKSSPDLHIQTITRPGMSTEDVIIPGNELKRIRYRWPTGERFPEIVILTKSGKEYASSLDTPLSFDPIVNPDKVFESHSYFNSYFVIPDAFLTDAQYVFDKRLYLVGDVMQGDQLEELELELINWDWNQDRHVKEIIFP